MLVVLVLPDDVGVAGGGDALSVLLEVLVLVLVLVLLAMLVLLVMMLVLLLLVLVVFRSSVAGGATGVAVVASPASV